MIWEVGGDIRRLPAPIETPVLKLSANYKSNNYNFSFQIFENQ